MFPRATNVAITAAIAGALHRLAIDFPSSAREFASRGLSRGERVCVQPTGHVYEFDGPFEHVSGASAGRFVRLKLVDSQSTTWDHTPIREHSVRAFPADEILRLRPTTRSMPRGKQNTDLGVWRESELDRLIEIRSGGNTALFRNRVMLLASRSEAERFAGLTSIIRTGHGHGTLADIVTWGSIEEGGSVQSGDRFQGAEEPLVAVTHVIERLADACEQSEPCSRLVLIDGVTPVVRNLQAYDRIAACQRTVIVGDHEDDEGLREIGARGCRVWHLSTGEILGLRDRASANVTGADPTGLVERDVGVFSHVRRGARNADHQVVSAVGVSDPALEAVAAALSRADRALGAETDEGVRNPLKLAFGALLDVSARFSPPTHEEAAEFQARMLRIGNEIQRQSAWTPPSASDALREAQRLMGSLIIDPLVGWPRMESLVLALDELKARHAPVAVVTRTAAAATALTTALPEYLRETRVYPVALLPDDSDLGTLIIASWLRKDAMSRLLGQYASPDLRLIACEFEARWLAQFLRGRKTRAALWRLDPSAKAAILGLHGTDSDMSWITSASGDDGDHQGETLSSANAQAQVTELLALSDAWERPHRKGTAAVVGIDLDRRPARYVGFVGQTYSYVTQGRSLPLVSELVRGGDLAQARVPMRTVEQLRPGDYILFRDQGERDVISLFAEHEIGDERYKERRAVAEQWKPVLRRLGATRAEIYRRLRDAGVTKHHATVRSWIVDPDKIGPGSQEDLHAIARAIRDPEFDAATGDIWDAICEIRGAHIAAGQKLSAFLLTELPRRLNAVGDRETYIDLTLVQAWLVEVEEIGELEERSYTEVNRLLWEPGAPRWRIATPAWGSRSVSDGR